MTESTQTDTKALSALAADCAVILRKQQNVIKEAQQLMMTQQISRAEVMAANPFQWMSEVVHEWALIELDQDNKVVALDTGVQITKTDGDPAKN